MNPGYVGRPPNHNDTNPNLNDTNRRHRIGWGLDVETITSDVVCPFTSSRAIVSAGHFRGAAAPEYVWVRSP